MKNLLPIKDILKILPSSGINNYVIILQKQGSRKKAVKELGKIEQDKIELKKVLQCCIYRTLSLV